MGHVTHHFTFGLGLEIKEEIMGRRNFFFFALRFPQGLFREVEVLLSHLYPFTHPIFIDPHLANYMCFWNTFSGIRVRDIIVINKNIRTAWQTVCSLCSRENKSDISESLKKERKRGGGPHEDMDPYGLGGSHSEFLGSL